jgi:RimJ/RimL family protein N-acetyltransferase
MIQLLGERILVREHRIDDLESVHQWLADPEVMKFLSWAPTPKEETYNYLADCLQDQQQKNRRKYRFAIERLKEKDVIGSISLQWKRKSRHGGDGRLGCFLIQSQWGKGYATEATRLVIDFGFSQFNMQRISATCIAENTASAQAILKCGLTYEGELRQHSFRCGKWRNRQFYSILREEWDLQHKQ